MKSEKKTHKKMGWLTKLILIVIGIAVAAALIWLIYYLVHFQFYNKYRAYLSSYQYEDGTEYKALKDSNAVVPDMDLVAENDILNLYAYPYTGYVSIYDNINNKTSRWICSIQY